MTPEAAHQHFLSTLKSMVGQDITKTQSSMAWPNRKIDETAIGNGLVRYRYWYVKDCIEIFDVDARTNMIVSATFEGTTAQCSIPP